MNSTQHQKLSGVIRQRLQSMAIIDKRYLVAVKAFNIAKQIHTGKRKDKVTPEFYHQVSLAGRAMSYHPLLADPVAVYVTLLLHDAYEDYPESASLLSRLFPDYIDYVIRISKVRHHLLPDGTFETVKINKSQYMSNVGMCPVCSVAKGLDRENNLSTMKGVFDYQKQLDYAGEVTTEFLPMLKKAKRLFPEQELIYEVIKSDLTLMRDNIEHYVGLIVKQQAL
jgi:(p)ppGpp synthase/HD superfamily hydrolase